MERTMEKVFEKACLIQLSASIWQGSSIVDLNTMMKSKKSNEWLRGRKSLVNPELLGPIKTSVHQARNTVQKYCLPFPITSLYLVPKESLSVIDENLQRHRDRFWEKVQDFEIMYEAAKEEARSVLGDLFNEADYPPEIARKFNFNWRFLTIDTPGKSGVLSPEIYEREKQKFVEMMNETRDLATTALSEEFGHVVEMLVERLSTNGEKPKVLSASMFNKLNEFLADFETKNIFNNERLQELTEEARSVINGVSTYNLRYNNGLREQLKEQMNNLKTSIDSAIDDLPRRKLRLAA